MLASTLVCPVHELPVYFFIRERFMLKVLYSSLKLRYSIEEKLSLAYSNSLTT